ncbi:hypothetical protein PoB_005330200, partial [Plakobranchus ocellatus]
MDETEEESETVRERTEAFGSERKLDSQTLEILMPEHMAALKVMSILMTGSNSRESDPYRSHGSYKSSLNSKRSHQWSSVDQTGQIWLQQKSVHSFLVQQSIATLDMSERAHIGWDRAFLVKEKIYLYKSTIMVVKSERNLALEREPPINFEVTNSLKIVILPLESVTASFKSSSRGARYLIVSVLSKDPLQSHKESNIKPDIPPESSPSSSWSTMSQKQARDHLRIEGDDNWGVHEGKVEARP